MKKILFLLLILISQISFAQNYVVKTSNLEKSFFIFTIKNQNQEIARLCVFDPKKGFHFFSNKSERPFFTNGIENNLNELAKAKKLGKPVCAILGSFKESEKVKKFYPGYFWESVALLFILPSYFEKVSIISTEKESQRFYLKITIGEKYFYSFLLCDKPITTSESKKLFTLIKELKLGSNIKPVPLNNFPVKMICFEDGKQKTIYTSNDSTKYSCLFMAGKQ